MLIHFPLIYLFLSWYFIRLGYIVFCTYRFIFRVQYFPHIIFVHPINNSIFFISSISSSIHSSWILSSSLIYSYWTFSDPWFVRLYVEGLFFRWPLCRGILLSVNDGFMVMAIPWRISDSISFFFTLEHETWLVYFIWCTLHRSIFLNRWWFLRHSCSFEVIRFLSNWSMRYGWVTWLDVFIREHNPFIGIYGFLRWLDQNTDTCESMQRSLVISKIALY